MADKKAEKKTIKGERRENTGKGFSRRLRREGKIPVSVYGAGQEAIPVSVPLTDLAAILRSETGHNTVFLLDVDGLGQGDVIFQDRQIDPIKGRLIHADLRRIAKGEKIAVTVPVRLIGEPAGVKLDGGLLQQVLREIRVLCETGNIPDHIDLDVSHLRAQESLHVSDIGAIEGVVINELPTTVIASVVYVKEETVVAAPTTEVAEPEVIGKGKKEEEPPAA